MTTFNKKFFRDENPGIFKSHPTQVIRNPTGSAALVKRFADSHDRPGAKRTVYYNDPVGDYEVKLELMLVELPAQLTTLTSATLTTSSGLPEGRILHASGLFDDVAGEDVSALWGVCFDAYYENKTNMFESDPAVTQLEIGDWIWVIRKGQCELKAGENGGSIAVADLLITDDDATHSEGGRVQPAGAIGDTSTANQASAIELRLPFKVIGVALETTAAENDLFLAKFDIETWGAEITTAP